MAFLDFWTGIDTEEEQRRQNNLDALLREENEKDRDARGDDWFAQAQAHVDGGTINVGKSIVDAFFGRDDAGFGIDDSNDQRIDGGTDSGIDYGSPSAPTGRDPKVLLIAGIGIGIAYLLFLRK